MLSETLLHPYCKGSLLCDTVTEPAQEVARKLPDYQEAAQ